jgi:microcystin-dependent protein
MRKTFLALAPVGALTLAAVLAVPSGPALACGPNSYIGSVCYMAGNYCPSGMRQLNVQGVTLPAYQYQVLYAVIGTIYGGSSSGNPTIGLPNLSGRTLAGAGQGPGLKPANLATYRGSVTQALDYTQMPPHTHTATFGVTFTGGNPSLTWQAAATGGTSAVPSATNSYVSGINPATNMWSGTLSTPINIQGTSAAVSGGFKSGTVSNASVGTGQAFDTRPPGVVLLACMPTDSGTYPYPPGPDRHIRKETKVCPLIKPFSPGC